MMVSSISHNGTTWIRVYSAATVFGSREASGFLGPGADEAGGVAVRHPFERADE